MFQRERMPKNSRFLYDESKVSGTSDYIIMPKTEDEVREVMRVNNSKGNKITIRGLGTGLCGGCVPSGEAVMTTEFIQSSVSLGKDDRGYYLRVPASMAVGEIDRILSGDMSNVLEDTAGLVESLKAEKTGYFYPVDPTELGGSIGGNVATNASGPRTYRYGPTRDWVRGLHVVFADGSLLKIKRGEIKADGRRMNFFVGRNYYSFDIPSYDSVDGIKSAVGPRIYEDMDLIDLFIGSEGIFGTITEVEVYLAPRKETYSCILFFPTDSDALETIKEIRSDEVLDPEFMEYMDCGSIDLIRRLISSDPYRLCIPQIPEGYGSALFIDLSADSFVRDCRIIDGLMRKHHSSIDNSWCGVDDKDYRRMRSMRHAIPSSIFEYVSSLKKEMPKIHKMGTDMSVPDGSIDEMMDYYTSSLKESGLEYVIFGHMGNNHPHVEIILKDMDDFEKATELYDRFAAKVISLGGSPSAEHGIGKIKTDYYPMMYGEKAVEELTRVKRILDVKMILNPGDLIGVVR